MVGPILIIKLVVKSRPLEVWPIDEIFILAYLMVEFGRVLLIWSDSNQIKSKNHQFDDFDLISNQSLRVWFWFDFKSEIRWFDWKWF